MFKMNYNIKFLYFFNKKMDNQDLANELYRIAEFYVQDKEIYRAKTYNEAATRIEAYPELLTSGEDAAKVIPRIGASLIKDINQFITTGIIDRLENLKQKHIDRNKVVEYYMTFYGIGPVIANKYYDAGFRTLEDLWTKASLTEAQKLSIYYREHLKLKIPRSEMQDIENYLRTIINDFNPGIEWIIAGSYRRLEPQSSDIDILIKERPDINLNDIVNLFNSYGILVGTLAQGPSKYLGILQIPGLNAHRIDLLIISPDRWPYAVLYFTGSQRFNILIRQRAKNMGLRLNEFGLTDTTSLTYESVSEENIFEHLKLEYLKPEERVRNLTSLKIKNV